MRNQPIRRALVAVFAVMAVLGAATAASADTVTADTDVAHPNVGGFVYLGVVDPGESVQVDVSFQLDCSGWFHVDRDQSVVLGLGANMVPEDGSVVATDVTIEAPGDSWPLDGDNCSSNPTPAQSVSPAHLTLTAPTLPGSGYLYTLTWTRELWVPTDEDDGTFTGVTAVTFALDVRGNTAPTLHLPSGVVLEGDTTGGAHAAYQVTATDVEDSANPTPDCAPAVGAVLPVGANTITCTATDSAGLKSTGTFTVTVVDTQAPVISNVPAPISLTTMSSFGAPLTYSKPTATDVVDSLPSLWCNPPSGAVAPVGDSTVMCFATDNSGNSTSVTIPVHVDLLLPPPTPTPTPTPTPAPTPTPTPAPTPTPTPAPTPTPTPVPTPDPTPVPTPDPTPMPTPVPTPTPTPVPTPTPTPKPTPTPTPTPAPDATWTAVWDEPIGNSPAQLSANGARSIPVKVRLYRDGVEVRTGDAALRVTPCGASEPVYLFDLSYGGRWTAKIDTSPMTATCYRVAAVINGAEAGWFRLDLPGASPVKSPGPVKDPKPGKTKI
jgi:HYR domain